MSERIVPRLPVDARFDALFRSQFDRVVHTLRRLGVFERDLEDSAHDVFALVYRKLDTYDPSRPVGPWVLGFAVRVAADYRVRARYRREVLDERIDESFAVTETPGDDESRRLVLAALEQLEEGRRTIFVLHHLQECSIPEISTLLGVPVNTAYSRLRLAREDFRRAVQRLRRREEAP